MLIWRNQRLREGVNKKKLGYVQGVTTPPPIVDMSVLLTLNKLILLPLLRDKFSIRQKCFKKLNTNIILFSRILFVKYLREKTRIVQLFESIRDIWWIRIPRIITRLFAIILHFFRFSWLFVLGLLPVFVETLLYVQQHSTINLLKS